ncbi:lysosomal acid glucosylceramidase [Microplitis demolitor]|uniref:lysosomal acid glucosylceramidase n=1 Tax=Microplitis demolitor TaxID=69319 RepID=UPI0004CDC620|nr:lysosomal acid glucosylceramidase [Microplitis demolitor]XP_008555897.1 lysosomal acid glucosylceramidase [Microplitis demolitor]XP_008555905.1 lysosomal acid glucosylceramidase [Microplitis demolitor]
MSMTVLFIILYTSILVSAENCLPRSFGEDSNVCVCNSTYCDFVTVQIPQDGQFRVYESSKSGQRLETKLYDFDKIIKSNIKLYLNFEKKYQTIHGFGGAFTDSSGININTLSDSTKEQLLQSYFGEGGSKYNLGRVPIGGTDFSPRPYSLDDTPDDVSLRDFSLAKEDTYYKIPYMKKALKINKELKFLSASWSAPPWMKTNHNYTGFLGFLKEEYYQIYADYLIKFLEDYKNQGLPIWAISTGNEPADVFALNTVHFNDMGWTPATVTEWVVNNLGPTLLNSTSNETIILALDDQRFDLPWYLHAMHNYNNQIDKYISGIAVHWYMDRYFPIELYDRTHTAFPNKFIIMTEACTGSTFWELTKVRLGFWKRGERYIMSIIDDLNHWITGWVDWNLALDKKGGPNWAKNYVDSAIIVNSETDEFYKQPMYYAIAHFSKFISRGSVRVDLTYHRSIKSVAFITPENTTVIVLYNKNDKPKNVTIVDPNKGNINLMVSEKTIQTIIYRH